MTLTPSDDLANNPDLQPVQQASDLSSQPASSEFDAEQALQLLRRKEGNWVNWGQTCQQLQKTGYTPQQIFEATGFEPIQQNQLIVATQVYQSIGEIGVSAAVQSRFERTGSDSLYELRILNQTERAAVAELLVQKGIDSEGAREIAKAVKEFSRLADLPVGFTAEAGDAVAYHYWKLARQQTNLQERSRLIAQALRFVSSDTARQQVEQLLIDFSATRTKAPTLPLYRLESEAELSRVVPVVGKLPLPTSALQAVPLVIGEGPFNMVRFTGEGAWVAVPGWQIILSADDPVGVLLDSDQLPSPIPGAVEEVLVICDRAQRDWDANSYFVTDQTGQLQIQWFDQEPADGLLSRVLVILRARKVLDEDFNKEFWQIDE
jgi:hypothetical protein